jgi:signal peptidase I
MDIPEPEGLTPKQLRSHRLAMWLLVPLLLALSTIVLVRFVLFDTARVSGPSMQPTLQNNDDVLLTRGWPDPRRGDVVVLHWTHDGTTEEIVKRVVGLPGDVVSVRGDFVTVNGKPEAFDHGIITSNETMLAEVTVPRGQMFFLGDNRAVSRDSRFIGTLPLTAIHGRVVAVWAPVTRMRVVPSP